MGKREVSQDRIDESREKICGDNRFDGGSEHYSNPLHLAGNVARYGFGEELAYVMGNVAGKCACKFEVGDVYGARRFLSIPVDKAILEDYRIFSEREIFEMKTLAGLVREAQNSNPGLRRGGAYEVACDAALKMYFKNIECESCDFNEEVVSGLYRESLDHYLKFGKL